MPDSEDQYYSDDWDNDINIKNFEEVTATSEDIMLIGYDRSLDKDIKISSKLLDPDKVKDYDNLVNKPQINGIELNKDFEIKGGNNVNIINNENSIIIDASGNNYTVLAVESGNITGTNEYWTGIVRGTSDNALSVTETALKKKPLTSLQFNVYGTDKKIIPGKYMRLIFSQDSNGNVTPTYISEEEWNNVYDV